jgi:hypothetical protein
MFRRKNDHAGIALIVLSTGIPDRTPQLAQIKSTFALLATGFKNTSFVRLLCHLAVLSDAQLTLAQILKK